MSANTKNTCPAAVPIPRTHSKAFIRRLEDAKRNDPIQCAVIELLEREGRMMTAAEIEQHIDQGAQAWTAITELTRACILEALQPIDFYSNRREIGPPVYFIAAPRIEREVNKDRQLNVDVNDHTTIGQLIETLRQFPHEATFLLLKDNLFIYDGATEDRIGSVQRH